MRAPAGLTLVELLVVLVVLGIAGAAALPTLAVLDRSKARDAAEELATAFREARDHATRRGERVSVVVDPATGAYTSFRSRGPPVDGTPVTDGIVAEGTVVDGGGAVTIAPGSPGPRIVESFDPLGRSTGTRVVVRDAESAFEVIVDRWTSAIRVRERAGSGS